jgi:hypothetical protein
MAKHKLSAFFADYRSAFPDWLHEGQVSLVRRNGILKQQISLVGLRTGGYRTICTTSSVVKPEARILDLFLSIAHDRVEPRAHERVWRGVVQEIEIRAVPAVREPIRADQVLHAAIIHEKEKHPHAGRWYGIACLAAHVGNTLCALDWCERVKKRSALGINETFEWEAEYFVAARHLFDAIEHGGVETYLSMNTDG